MGGENRKPVRPLPVSSRTLLFLSFLLLLLLLLIVNPSFAKDHKKSSSDKSAAYSPPDSYLLDCGSSEERKLDDGRTFLSDSASRGYLETTEEVQISVDSIPVNTSSVSSPYALSLYRSARILTAPSRYSLHISQPGWHWLRLYFYAVPHPQYNLTTAVFDVVGDDFVLIHDFSIEDDKTVVFKEYLINISKNEFILFFNPRPNSFAFINALEFVSAPDDLISDSASTLPQGGTFSGALGHAFEVSYRLNVGGKVITPVTDTLSRTWVPDTAYNAFPEGVQQVSVRANDIKYPNKGANPYIAPKWVYSTADVMANSETLQPNFNLTWKMNVDPGFSYLIRLHFCDIISRNLNVLYFNVYINSLMGVSSLDLSSINNALATAYYADFVLNSTFTVNGSVTVQIGPASGFVSGTPNGTLNGLEVIKMSNSLRSLDGSFSMESYQRKTMKIVAGVGIALGFTALAALAVIFFRSHKKPQDDFDKRKSFSSWLLPLNSTSGSFLSSKSSSRRSSIFGSRKSKSSHSGYFYNQGLGRFFTLSELQHATQNFNEKAVVGVGGFGKVYLGVLDDGTSVAIKRATKGSEQGINEFQTELELLSKLRHRHLVSLIGFSDEKSEMILVYEYMYNGPFRDHLYGSNKPPLSWKQRLEICIGAARGLHYLHTGTAHGIIHRDVKTTNILLDDNLVAKVSDFGLSKCAPMEQGHVSTAVKGSFGYLDPEYFRTQQLTEKSDVYSFGVVLFEVLCARPVISPGLSREQVNLADWAMQCHRKGLIEKVIDPHISGSICPGSLKKYVEAAEKCLAQYGVDRPGIGDVLWNLEYALQLQDAFSQTNLIEEKSVILIPLETPTARHTPGQDTSSDRDDSETSPAYPLYTQIQNFQGR